MVSERLARLCARYQDSSDSTDGRVAQEACLNWERRASRSSLALDREAMIDLARSWSFTMCHGKARIDPTCRVGTALYVV